MKRLMIAAFALLPSLALADQLDRLIVATDKLTALTFAFYTDRVPELKGALPDMSIDAEMSAAMQCMLDQIERDGGTGTAEVYVASMERLADTLVINSLEDMGNMMGDLDQQLAMDAMMNCGQMEISMRRMQESGLFEAMQKPGVMEALLALE